MGYSLHFHKINRMAYECQEKPRKSLLDTRTPTAAGLLLITICKSSGYESVALPGSWQYLSGKPWEYQY